jgi:membrane fusion protein (multidrug efflux system)
VAGKLVKAGQPLFSIDARNYEASVAQVEAAVAAGEAAIALIDQNIIMQRDVVDQAQANLEAADAERIRASLDHTRYEFLVRDGWATHQRFESATADSKKANASVAAAKAALATARQQSEVLSAQRRQKPSSMRPKPYSMVPGPISTKP